MTSPPPPATDWRLVWLLVFTGLAVAGQIGKVPPALPAIRAELGMDLPAAGWFVSLVNLMSAAAGTLAALTADRVGHRRLATAGLVAGVLASSLGALTSSATTLFASRVIEGLSFLVVVVSMPPLILRASAPGDVRQVMALWGAYLPGGAGLMALASAGLLPTVGWRGVWWAAAAVLVRAGLVVLSSTAGRGSNALPRTDARTLGRDMIDATRSRGALAIAACFGCSASSWFALIAMALTAAGVFLELLPPALRLGLAFAFSAVSSAIPGALFAAVPVHAPRPALIGATTGVLMQGSNLGALMGPPIVAALVSAGSWSWALFFTTPGAGRRPPGRLGAASRRAAPAAAGTAVSVDDGRSARRMRCAVASCS